MKITVLGCGPAGLLVAHAAAQSGHETTILSRKVRSKIGGAQYLHTNIPDLTTKEPDGHAHFEYRGTDQGYAQKVYGDPQAVTSWGGFMGNVPIWNMRRAYDELWDRYEGLIKDSDLDPIVLETLQESGGLTLSTIPRTELCVNSDHSFTRQEVLIWYGRKYTGDRDQVIYSGHPDTPWYRFSNLFGWESIEWPARIEVDAPDLIRVKKPISTDCDCLPEIQKLGRYGRWEKKVLSHDAYWEALRLIARAEQGLGNAPVH